AATQCGWVAQLAEQRTENPRVGGSIPPPAISMRMRRGAAVVQLARVELAGSLRDEAALFVRFAYFADWGVRPGSDTSKTQRPNETEIWEGNWSCRRISREVAPLYGYGHGRRSRD